MTDAFDFDEIDCFEYIISYGNHGSVQDRPLQMRRGNIIMNWDEIFFLNISFHMATWESTPTNELKPLHVVGAGLVPARGCVSISWVGWKFNGEIM